jgi:hypothetical protein
MQTRTADEDCAYIISLLKPVHHQSVQPPCAQSCVKHITPYKIQLPRLHTRPEHPPNLPVFFAMSETGTRPRLSANPSSQSQTYSAPPDPPPMYDARPLPAGWVKEFDVKVS